MNAVARGSADEVFLVFLRLGLTAFGGPVAHLAYFRDEFVVRRHWLGEAAYAELVALCQVLPGPASSQVGFAIGLRRAGYPGALAAFLGFTLPSAALMVAFAFGAAQLGTEAAGVLHGLKVAAVAVVALAVVEMARAHVRDAPRAVFAIAAATLLLTWPAAIAPILAILAAGIAGRFILPAAPARLNAGNDPALPPIARAVAAGALALFAVLLVVLPLAADAGGSRSIDLADAFYRSGALVFGGGHVVLPLLQAAVVDPGYIAQDVFVAGYGAAQALPGPLFSFAAYLGAAMPVAPSGLAGAALCLGAIYLPAFLVVLGAAPLWQAFRARPGAQAALAGINAAVVGLLLAALIDPVMATGILRVADGILAGAAFLLLWLRIPPWLVVGLCALAGWALGPG